MKNAPAQATLIIGSHGFLGKNIRKMLELHDHIYTSIRGDTKHVYDSLGEVIGFDAFAKFESVTVFNCSSGRLQTIQFSNESNFLFPNSVLDELSRFSSRIIWIQFDSYTQYTSGRIHDKNYVDAKNKFNNELDKKASTNNLLEYTRISLPHLYGPGDNSSRFLPKVFSKILQGIDVQVTSSREVLPLIDVEDCAKEVIAISIQRGISSKKILPTKVSVPPTESIDLYCFLNSFKAFFNSRSLISRGQDDSNIFIEKWKEREQPPIFLSQKNRSSREETFWKLKKNLDQV